MKAEYFKNITSGLIFNKIKLTKYYKIYEKTTIAVILYSSNVFIVCIKRLNYSKKYIFETSLAKIYRKALSVLDLVQ